MFRGYLVAALINSDMQQLTIAKLPASGSEIIVEDEVNDQVELNNITLKNCRFLRLGLKDVKFAGGFVTQTHFEDCYLRKATFVGIDLTGCVFRNCNLEKAKFQGCTLKYCRFENSLLNVEEIASCLPAEPNIRLSLLRSLRMNSAALGDGESVDMLLDLEIEALADNLRGIIKRKTSYYKEHYSEIDRVSAFLRLVAWKINDVIWGRGRRIRRLAVSYGAVTLILACIAYFSDVQFSAPEGSSKTLSLTESILHAFGRTLGGAISFGDPVTIWGRLLQIGEALTGACFLALLASALYRRIAR